MAKKRKETVEAEGDAQPVKKKGKKKLQEEEQAVDAADEAVPARRKGKKKQEALVQEQDAADEVTEPVKQKKKKKHVQEEEQAEEEAVEPMPRKKKKQTREAEAVDKDMAEPTKKKKKQKLEEAEAVAKEEPEAAAANDAGEEHKAFVGGLPWSVDEATLRRDFEECGEVLEVQILKEKETGRSRGIGFVTMKTAEGLEAALKWDGEDYGGRSLKVTKATEKDTTKSKDLAARLEVFVKGLAKTVTEDVLWKDFLECGKIARMNMPLDSAGRCKGFAWITFKSAEARDKAIKFDGQDYAGQKLNVEKSGQHRSGNDASAGAKGGGKGSNGLEVFVKNFPYETEEAEVREAFSKCGDIARLNMPTNKKGGYGRCMGFAWITFTSKEAVEKACKMTGEDVAYVGGRKVFVEKSGQHRAK